MNKFLLNFLIVLGVQDIVWVDQAGAAALIEKYRSIFPQEEVNETAWRVDHVVSKITGIIEDPANSSDFLLITDEKVIIRLPTSNLTAVVSAGKVDESGCDDGPGLQAKFGDLEDIVYIHSLDFIVIADGRNRCLRKFNYQNLRVSLYAGKCSKAGDLNGYRLDARFNTPKSLLMDESEQLLYIMDESKRKIKTLSLLTDEVTPWLILPSDGTPKGFSFPPAGSECALVLQGTILYENSYNGLQELLQLSSSPYALRRIVSLSPNIHLVTNVDIRGVQLVDRSNNMTFDLCRRDMRYSSESSLVMCSLVSTTSSLMTSKGYIHIPGLNENQIVIKTLKIESSALEWDSRSSCNASQSIGTQTRITSHAFETCNSTGQYQPVGTRPSLENNDTEYTRVKKGCHLDKKLSDSRHMIECATQCMVDDECPAFSYTKSPSECRKAIPLEGGSADCYLKPV